MDRVHVCAPPSKQGTWPEGGGERNMRESFSLQAVIQLGRVALLSYTGGLGLWEVIHAVQGHTAKDKDSYL